MDTYKLVISYNSKQYSTGNTTDVDTYLLLDTIQERTVSGTNTTPSQPMQSGDTISDHTYREPNTYNISGSFSLDGDKVYNLGNQNDYVNDFTKTKMDRLSRIQETFEAIKKGGYLCTLTFMSMPDNTTSLSNAVLSNASTRFKIRKNMQLKSFQWSEKLNTFIVSVEKGSVKSYNSLDKLYAQYDAMIEYSNALYERIKELYADECEI